jgi:hypothetical protein
MQRRGMSQAAIVAALTIENANRCDPPLAAFELDTIAKSVGRYERAGGTVLPTFSLLDDAELLTRPAPLAVIEERLFENSFVALYGPPGVGKTFVAQDLAFCVATGKPWLGADVLQPGAVVYVAAEGAGGLTLPVRAWKTYHEVSHQRSVGVHTLPTAVNLMELADTQRLLETIRPLAPKMVVFDTLARCLVGGDENSAKDMGLMINHCDLLRVELNAIVLLVHHTQKNGPSERGSGALRGACETMLELTNANDLLTLSCDKQKDAMPFRSVRLELHAVRLADQTQDSCVVRPAAGESLTLTASDRRALAALREQFTGEGASKADWMKAAQVSERNSYRVCTHLEQLGYVRKESGGYVWTGKPPSE